MCYKQKRKGQVKQKSTNLVRISRFIGGAYMINPYISDGLNKLLGVMKKALSAFISLINLCSI